ncbi:MAG: rhombotarget lipoprotein [Marinicellaceae bacterium]
MIIRTVFLLLILTLNGCALLGGHHTRHTKSTSLVQFLYPKGNPPMQDKVNPTLNLPLKVGLAFIPEQNNSATISMATKNNLLENVKAAFQSKVYVDEIIIVPEIYLQRSQGFSTLEQIKNLYQLDVIALVSYDQVVNGKDNILALSYLTIVGAYIFPGTGYDVSTLIDLAVIDIESLSILFRAAGTSGEKDIVAEGYKQQAYLKKQNKGFKSAMAQMQTNLLPALDQFEQRLRAKDPNDTIKVRHREGYSGSFPVALLILLTLIASLKSIIVRVKNTQ